MKFFGFVKSELAIDLGTANMLIIHNSQLVVDEPSVIAQCQKFGKLIAVGRKAEQMDGKTHSSIRTIRPLRNGVIADLRVTEEMIKALSTCLNHGVP